MDVARAPASGAGGAADIDRGLPRDIFRQVCGAVDSTSVPPEAARPAGRPPLPSAEQYARHGISLTGLQALAAAHREQITAATSTSDVCHTIIKPATVPAGWTDRYEHILVDDDGEDVSAKRWYKHSYVNKVDGSRRGAKDAPPGTVSYCELLLADPATAHHVGRPTVFLSHTWLFGFLNVLAALEAFVAARPAGAPEVFFWFDCCSIDQHATQALPPVFWSSTFKEAIRLIGHTVMMLSPWDSPVPLTRAWCLWELHCTVEVGAEFSVCLGPDEQAELEAALLRNSGALFTAFAGINVVNAQASRERDRVTILDAVRAAAGGTSALNALAMTKMRAWVHGVVSGMVAARRDPDDGSLAHRPVQELREVCTLADVLRRTGDSDDARRLLEEVATGQTEHLGLDHIDMLRTQANLAIVRAQMGERAEARRLYEVVLAGQSEQLGPTHTSTLRTKMGLAVVLADMGEQAEARAMYEAVAESQTYTIGPVHPDTLRTKMNLANLLRRMGQSEEARRLYEAVLSHQNKIIGPAHISTLATKANLANVLQQMGERAEARRLYEVVLAGQSEQLGPTHTSTLRTKMGLAIVVADMAEQAEALLL
eukprot:SAG22_NODE_811_length_7061_cov_84.983338_7_plen_598_part_00